MNPTQPQPAPVPEAQPDTAEQLDLAIGSPFGPLDSDDIEHLIETGRVWIPPSLRRAA